MKQLKEYQALYPIGNLSSPTAIKAAWDLNEFLIKYAIHWKDPSD